MVSERGDRIGNRGCLPRGVGPGHRVHLVEIRTEGVEPEAKCVELPSKVDKVAVRSIVIGRLEVALEGLVAGLKVDRHVAVGRVNRVRAVRTNDPIWPELGLRWGLSPSQRKPLADSGLAARTGPFLASGGTGS